VLQACIGSICKKAPRWSLFTLCLLIQTAQAGQPASDAIASAHPQATAAGMAVLQVGGNAFDAAVAVSAALAVVEPYSSGIGGGGFWLLHRASDGKQVMVDGRERAPLASTRNMYLDEMGEPIDGLSINGPLSAGIPGEPAALVHIAEKYGRLPLQLSLAPAIHLARDGFAVDKQYRKMAGFRLKALQKSSAATEQFLLKGEIPPIGHKIVQADLADTLQAIAEQGTVGFYHGEVAQRLVDGVKKAGGIWSLEDLAQYKVIERAPLVGQYRGRRVVSAAPPSSGGVILIEMLNMLQQLDIQRFDSTQRVHLMTEVMRRAYEDRALHLGDTDFVDVPLDHLLSPSYARLRVSDINPDKASVSQTISGLAEMEGNDTTHFSIIDKAGNRVSATLSVNYPFGSCFVPPGTGVLLNDEMDDFSIKPGTPNAYGLVGNEANAIEPGKRMLSSMSPTFIETDDDVAILGTPGGSRIISMVLIGALEAMRNAPVDHWVGRARFHHQYLPDVIQFEPGALSEKTQNKLRVKGHELEEKDDYYGNMQAVHWDKKTNKVTAGSDPRGIGAAAVIPE